MNSPRAEIRIFPGLHVLTGAQRATILALRGSGLLPPVVHCRRKGQTVGLHRRPNDKSILVEIDRFGRVLHTRPEAQETAAPAAH